MDETYVDWVPEKEYESKFDMAPRRHVTSRAENQQVLSPLFEKNELWPSTCSAFSKVICPQILRSYMHIVGKY